MRPYRDWKTFRWRFRVWCLVLFGGALAMFAVVSVLQDVVPKAVYLGQLSKDDKPWEMAVAFFVAWVALLGVMGEWVAVFRCPRCGEFYFGRNFWHNPFAKQCAHCQLPKWQEVEKKPEGT